MATRIRVSVIKLIEEIEKRREEARAESEREAEAYPALLAEWKADCLAKLREWGESVERGESPGHNNYCALPSRPSKPIVAFTRYDRDIKTLQMSAEPSIAITSEDYARYLS